MKKEIYFYKDKRGGFTAENFIKFYKSLGWTNEQIKAEMQRIKKENEKRYQENLKKAQS